MSRQLTGASPLDMRTPPHNVEATSDGGAQS